MPVRLFVGNLPYQATEAELREHFSAVGTPSQIYLPTDRENGQPRGFAFVDFNDRAEAEEAIRRFNNQPFKGRPVAVSEARAREDRQSSGVSSRPTGINTTTQPDPATAPGAGGRESRSFGPDALPQRRRVKEKGASKSPRVPKGTMRELSTGQFFGDSGDDGGDDDLSMEDHAGYGSDDSAENTTSDGFGEGRLLLRSASDHQTGSRKTRSED